MLIALVAIAVVGQAAPDRDVGISLGPGASFYGGDQAGPVRDVTADGLFLRGDFGFRTRAWFAPRFYVGALDTVTDRVSCRGAHPCDVQTDVFFAGAGLRFILPIPWVAPFVEIGGGPSFGHIATRFGPAIERDRSGAFGHVDFAFGLGLGRYHQLEVGVYLLDHPGMRNIGGGLTVGLRFPL